MNLSTNIFNYLQINKILATVINGYRILIVLNSSVAITTSHKFKNVHVYIYLYNQLHL